MRGSGFAALARALRERARSLSTPRHASPCARPPMPPPLATSWATGRPAVRLPVEPGRGPRPVAAARSGGRLDDRQALGDARDIEQPLNLRGAARDRELLPALGRAAVRREQHLQPGGVEELE